MTFKSSLALFLNLKQFSMQRPNNGNTFFKKFNEFFLIFLLYIISNSDLPINLYSYYLIIYTNKFFSVFI